MSTPIPPIGAFPAITPPGPATAPAPATGGGFADAIGRNLQEVSSAEHRVDAMLTDLATGGGTTSVHELMIATTEASLATDALVAVRDRALEAYHEIMRLQL